MKTKQYICFKSNKNWWCLAMNMFLYAFKAKCYNVSLSHQWLIIFLEKISILSQEKK